MPHLEYDLAVVGASKVEAALSGIERRFVQHNAKISRATGSSAGSPTKAASDAETRNILRNMTKGLQSFHKAELRQIKDAERERIASIKRVERAKESAAKKAEREAIRAAKAEEKAKGRFRRSVSGSIASGIGRTASITGALLAGGIGLAGGATIMGAVQNRMAVQNRAIALANSGYVPGQAKSRAQVAQELTELADQNAKSEGVGAEDSLKGMQAFVGKTGDLEAAKKTLGFQSRLSIASGTDLGDLGESSASVWAAIGTEVKDSTKQLEVFKDVMSTLAGQGKIGAVEVKDLAHGITKLVAGSVAFEGGSAKLTKTLGGLAQMAVQTGGAADAAEAMTGAIRLGNDITKHQAKFKKAGVNVLSADKKTLRDPIQIMADLLSKTGGDITKTNGLFGNESVKMFIPLKKVFLEAEKDKKGSGREAIVKAMEKYTQAIMSAKEVDESAAAVRATTSKQFEEKMEAFNAAVGSKLLPAITQLIDPLSQLIPLFVSLATAAADVINWYDKLTGGNGNAVDRQVQESIEGSNLQSHARAEFKTTGKVSPETQQALVEYRNKVAERLASGQKGHKISDDEASKRGLNPETDLERAYLAKHPGEHKPKGFTEDRLTATVLGGKDIANYDKTELDQKNLKSNANTLSEVDAALKQFGVSINAVTAELAKVKAGPGSPAPRVGGPQ